MILINNKLNKTPLIVITGETASGKSSIAMSLAQKINGEIICADSKTVYRDMDIGTAKPTLDDQQKVRHWCLDLVDPDQKFNVALFKKEANAAIKDIKSRCKIPILVGGSGLYVYSIIYNYKFRTNKADDRYSNLDNKTVSELIDICNQKGYKLPENKFNKRYLIKVIESKGDVVKNTKLFKNVIYVGVENDKNQLEQKIRRRIIQMVDQGLIEETKNLYKKYNSKNESFTADIYPIVKRYIDNEISMSEMIELAVIKDRQLAKKQRTWFKRDNNIKWLKKEQVEKYILGVLK